MGTRPTSKEWEWIMESLQRLDFILRALVQGEGWDPQKFKEVK